MGEQSAAMLSLQLDAAGVLLENAMKENDELREQLVAAQAELIAERRNHAKYVALNDADANRIVTCAFCGKHYEGETPEPGSSILSEHIRVCEKHPIAALRTALEKIVEIEKPKSIDYDQAGNKFEDPTDVMAIAMEALDILRSEPTNP